MRANRELTTVLHNHVKVREITFFVRESQGNLCGSGAMNPEYVQLKKVIKYKHTWNRTTFRILKLNGKKQQRNCLLNFYIGMIIKSVTNLLPIS